MAESNKFVIASPLSWEKQSVPYYEIALSFILKTDYKPATSNEQQATNILLN